MENRTVDPGSIQGSHRPISFTRIKYTTRRERACVKVVKLSINHIIIVSFSSQTPYWNILRSSILSRARINKENFPNRIDSNRFFYESTVSFIWLVKKWITKKAFVDWGEGNRWQVDPIELKNKSQKTLFSNPIGSNRFDVEFIQLAWHVPTVQHPWGNPSVFGDYRRPRTRH